MNRKPQKRAKDKEGKLLPRSVDGKLARLAADSMLTKRGRKPGGSGG